MDLPVQPGAGSNRQSGTGQAGIAGTVEDNSGGVLPGVSITAASPQLIEQTRTVVTDGIETGTQIGSRSQFVGGVGLITDQANIAEMVYDTSAQSAEFVQSGLRTNMIPKAGGNTFSGDLFLSGTNESFATSNLTQELEDEGFAFSPTAYT